MGEPVATGDPVGLRDIEGTRVCRAEGFAEGLQDGELESDGNRVGLPGRGVGIAEGEIDGRAAEGGLVGICDGRAVGRLVGRLDVGDLVGGDTVLIISLLPSKLLLRRTRFLATGAAEGADAVYPAEH